jgi:indolepyruvate ferredoxin oxidoreductase beta subunit
MNTPRPISILIAALGGEGGGVLTEWIVGAAVQAGFPVQSTSIPGVAQRTGATTYYIEILPVPSRDLGNKRPVLALTPGVGDIDIASRERIARSRSDGRQWFCHARPHARYSFAQPLLCHG